MRWMRLALLYRSINSRNCFRKTRASVNAQLKTLHEICFRAYHNEVPVRESCSRTPRGKCTPPRFENPCCKRTVAQIKIFHLTVVRVHHVARHGLSRLLLLCWYLQEAVWYKTQDAIIGKNPNASDSTVITRFSGQTPGQYRVNTRLHLRLPSILALVENYSCTSSSHISVARYKKNSFMGKFQKKISQNEPSLKIKEKHQISLKSTVCRLFACNNWTTGQLPAHVY